MYVSDHHLLETTPSPYFITEYILIKWNVKIFLQICKWQISYWSSLYIYQWVIITHWCMPVSDDHSPEITGEWWSLTGNICNYPLNEFVAYLILYQIYILTVRIPMWLAALLQCSISGPLSRSPPPPVSDLYIQNIFVAWMASELVSKIVVRSSYLRYI